MYYASLKNKQTRTVDLTDLSGNKIPNPQIVKLMRNPDNNLFLFTRDGLYVFDTEKEVILKHFLIKSSQYVANVLNCCCLASSSDLWIGTRGGGVNLFSMDETYRNFNQASGFDAKTVYSILEDKTTQFIWLATDNGLICYDPFQNQFRKVNLVDSRIYGSFYPRHANETRGAIAQKFVLQCFGNSLDGGI
ncbi:hypothetical protein FACS1894145_1910 [Bacteroidia bacterium]|nr:hypothetical protein FACS1894145_1910 [Bacteroidia bacterium]